MAVKLAFNEFPQFIDGDGVPITGAQLFTYIAGSSTKATTYQDDAGSTPNSNPIVCDSAGRVPYPVWLTTGVSYKFVLAPADDTDPPTSPIWTLDDVTGINDASISLDQWIAGPTPTYINATSFSLVGDQTSTFLQYRRVKCTVTAGTVYGTITSSAYTSLTTVTVAFDSSGLDSGLTAVAVGLITQQNSSLLNVQNWPRSIGRNITGQNNSGSPNSQFDWNADEFVVKDANGIAKLLTALDVTVDITASGANGLDTGSEANSTWYYGHIIYNPTTDTVAGLLSTSWTAPTLPSGYTFSAPIGAVRNNGSGNFLGQTQEGNEISYKAAQLFLSAGGASTETSIDYTAFVPPVATRANVTSNSYIAASGAARAYAEVRVVSGSLYVFASRINLISAGAGTDACEFSIPCLFGVRPLYYLWTTEAGTLTDAQLNCSINAFTLPIGGQ